MNVVQYKEETKCKWGALVTAVFLLLLFGIDGANLFQGFAKVKNIGFYVAIRDILPGIVILGIVVTMMVWKNVPKIPLFLLSGLFLLELLGQCILLSENRVHFGVLLTAENLIKLIVNLLAVVITLMVSLGGLKASAGSLCVTLGRGIFVFFYMYSLSGFVQAALMALFAMFLLSAVEDYEEKPLSKITGESVHFARRNVSSCVVLTIVTLGIFGIVWLVKVCKDLRKLHGDENPVGSEILLYLFVPFYSVYWGYAKGKQMYEDSKKRGGNITDRKYIYFFMNLLFMQLFTLGFIQVQLNNYQNR